MTQYIVKRSGGSLGESQRGNVVATYNEADKLKAQQHARRLNRMLTPGERSYYKIRYSVQKREG